MTIDSANPWQSKETKLTFKNTCGDQTVTLNQTNYALQANNQFVDTYVVFTEAGTHSFPVISNAKWTTKLENTNKVIADTTTSAIGSVGGEEKKDGTTKNTSFEYNAVLTTGLKYMSSAVTFSDNEQAKRFNDITVTMINCNKVDADPTLEQWTIRLGFPSLFKFFFFICPSFFYFFIELVCTIHVFLIYSL